MYSLYLNPVHGKQVGYSSFNEGTVFLASFKIQGTKPPLKYFEHNGLSNHNIFWNAIAEMS